MGQWVSALCESTIGAGHPDTASAADSGWRKFQVEFQVDQVAAIIMNGPLRLIHIGDGRLVLAGTSFDWPDRGEVGGIVERGTHGFQVSVACWTISTIVAEASLIASSSFWSLFDRIFA